MAETALQMPSRRERQRTETRERLFLAACAEIDRVGLSEAEIPRIAQEAGVARATFYFHFPSKEDVLSELVSRLQTGLTRSISELDTTGLPLRAVIGRMLEHISQTRSFVGESNLMREVLALHVRRAQDETFEDDPGIPAALAPHFAAAAARGEIRSTIEPERLSAIFLSSLFGLMLGASRNERDIEGELNLLADLFLRGLAT